MGVVSLEMCYRNDVSIYQPFGTVATGVCLLGLVYYSGAGCIVM